MPSSITPRALPTTSPCRSTEAVRGLGSPPNSSSTRSNRSPRASLPPGSSLANASASCRAPGMTGPLPTTRSGTPVPLLSPSMRPHQRSRSSGSSVTPTPSASSSRAPRTRRSSTRYLTASPIALAHGSLTTVRWTRLRPLVQESLTRSWRSVGPRSTPSHSPPSFTRPARPGGPRAACSHMATSCLRSTTSSRACRNCSKSRGHPHFSSSLWRMYLAESSNSAASAQARAWVTHPTSRTSCRTCSPSSPPSCSPYPESLRRSTIPPSRRRRLTARATSSTPRPRRRSTTPSLSTRAVPAWCSR